jgi:hypothetical protein
MPELVTSLFTFHVSISAGRILKACGLSAHSSHSLPPKSDRHQSVNVACLRSPPVLPVHSSFPSRQRVVLTEPFDRTGWIKGRCPIRATRRCPVKPTTPLGPDQVNVLLLSDRSPLEKMTTVYGLFSPTINEHLHGEAPKVSFNDVGLPRMGFPRPAIAVVFNSLLKPYPAGQIPLSSAPSRCLGIG